MRAKFPLLPGLIFLSFTAHANNPIVQPGAPGEAPRLLSPEEAIEVADTRYTASDATFMRNMIPHHQQALEMSKLAAARTNSPEVLDISARIEASQGDEITFMEQWLVQRGEPVRIEMQPHAHHSMRGMATPEQMGALAAASATEFDRQISDTYDHAPRGRVTHGGGADGAARRGLRSNAV